MVHLRPVAQELAPVFRRVFEVSTVTGSALRSGAHSARHNTKRSIFLGARLPRGAVYPRD